MAKVVFELTNGVDGEVELRDNFFMDYWKMIFRRNLKLCNVRKDKSVYHMHKRVLNVAELHDLKWEETRELRRPWVEQINAGIDRLIECGYHWSKGYMTEDSKWEDCNRIHRGFTTYHQTEATDHWDLDRWQLGYIKHTMQNIHANGYWITRQTDPNIADIIRLEPGEFKSSNYLHTEVGSALSDINAYTHRIEDYCLVSPRVHDIYDGYLTSIGRDKKVQATWLPVLDWNSKGVDGSTDSIKTDWNFGELRKLDYSIYDSSPEWNVYDLKNILGKDYEKAYVDYDDPMNWDVTNTCNTTKGGFEIKPHMSYLTNTIIKPWAAEYGVEPDDHIVAPISVGRISQRWIDNYCFHASEEEVDAYQNVTIEKVDLID